MSSTDSQYFTPHHCSRSRPCNRWRVCSFCARRRQARIADAVERLSKRCGSLHWTILYPFASSERGIKQIKDDWLRHAAPSGAIWTIEQSQKNGNLHCNIIAPSDALSEPATGHQWRQQVAGDPRHVGAYISKPRQAPTDQAFSGRLFGTAGPLWQWLAGSQSEPVVAAAAAQHIIDREKMVAESIIQIDHAQELLRQAARTGSQVNREKWAKEERLENHAKEKTPEEYRAIAARWLPDILANLA